MGGGGAGILPKTNAMLVGYFRSDMLIWSGGCFRSDMLIWSGGCFRSDMLIWRGGWVFQE